MRTLLRIQALDLRIEECKRRECEIPKQKQKFEVQKKRLADELRDAELRCKNVELSQRNFESENEQKSAQIIKYEQQLMGVKKNEEYQALLHEIEGLKKQIAQNEERILLLMEDLEEAKKRLDEDKRRIADESARIDKECAGIDEELAEAVSARKKLELEREPMLADVDPQRMQLYVRIRQRLKTGRAVVPLNGESCGGCHMRMRPQIVNEVLGGEVRVCPHCSRMIYDKHTHEPSNADATAL